MTVRWMLDTNACIAVMNDDPPAVRERLISKAVDQVGISVVVLYELVYGVRKSRHRRGNQATLDAFLRYVERYEWTEECAVEAGKLRADLVARGTPIGPHDLLIGAHAMSLGATLVTHNVREFERVRGLKIEDWKDP